MAETELTI